MGTRAEAASHLTTAIENGFAYAVVKAPLVIADGLTGTAEVEVEINGSSSSVYLAEAIVEADSLVALTHFKCHELTGFGGAIKNLGMGCASRKGKLVQHSNVAPVVPAKHCTGCGICLVPAPMMPSSSTRDGKAVIDPQKCIGCPLHHGLPHGHQHPVERAPTWSCGRWPSTPGCVTGRTESVFVSFITQVSPACDCYGHADCPSSTTSASGLPGPGGHRPGLRRPGQPGPGSWARP